MNVFSPFGAHAPPRDPAALARAIVSQPRFRIRVQAAQARTWWDALRDWLGARWNQLMDAFAHHVHIGRGTTLAAGDLLIAAAIVLTVVVAVRLLLTASRENTAAGSRAVIPLAHHADARELHEAAQRAAKDAAYAAAIALMFRAALATLDARGALRDDPSRTVNECRRDVRARVPRLSAPFDVIARAFTAAVYAEDRVSAEDWTGVESAYQQFGMPHGDAA